MGARERWRQYGAAAQLEDEAFVEDFNTCVLTLSDWVTYAGAWLPEYAAASREEVIFRRKREHGWKLVSTGYGIIHLLEDGRLVQTTAGNQGANKELKLHTIEKSSESGKKGVISAHVLKMLCMDIFSNNPYGMFTTSEQKALRDRQWGSPVATTFPNLRLP